MEVIISKNSFGSQLHGGQYEASSDSGSFPSWCAERTQFLHLGEKIDYQRIDGMEAWGSPISAAIDRLMSWSSGNGWPTTADQNDAIQNDIWSLLAGGTGKIDTSSTAVTQHASLLHNEIKQDLLISHAVSEPNPLAVLSIGLALIVAGAYRWIRPPGLSPAAKS